MHDATGLQQLIAEYGQLQRLESHTPQSRGQRFNEVIASMLRCWGIYAQVSVRSAGEIDVAFAVGSQRYILEAKWEKNKADTGDLAKLQRRVGQRFQGTVGLFLAIAGYTPDALSEVDRGARLEVLLLDRHHFEAMLSGFVPPQELLKRLHDRAAFRGEAYTQLLDLLTTTSAPPTALFDTVDELGKALIISAHRDVSAAPMFTLPDSDQLGIAVRETGRLLVTTQGGIVEIDLDKRRSSWAVPIADCHRNSMVQPDGSILFTRRYGIARFTAGELSIVSGGFAGATCLIGRHDDSHWVLDNGDLSGTPGPSITCIGVGLGDEIRHSLTYPLTSAVNAVWVDESNLLTIGNPGFLITNIVSGATRMISSARSNPMGLVRLGDNVILTASDSVSLGITDLTTGQYADIMTLALKPSVNEITAGPKNEIYLASYYHGTKQHLPITVVAISIPSSPGHFAASVLAEANRDNLAVFRARVEQIRTTITVPIQEETERQRLERLYNEAHTKVRVGLSEPLQAAIASSGLRLSVFDGRSLEDWLPDGYGGSASIPTWGIETLRSPWLALAVGVAHRVNPAEDLRDLVFMVVLARMRLDGQHDYIRRFGTFESGSEKLDQLIDQIRSDIQDRLPEILEDFLVTCTESGEPR